MFIILATERGTNIFEMVSWSMSYANLNESIPNIHIMYELKMTKWPNNISTSSCLMLNVQSWNTLVEGDGGSYWPDCQRNLV